MFLIIGGTGSMGRAAVKRLLELDKPTRVLTRTPEKASDLQQLGAEIVAGDLTDAASLQRACAGAEAIIMAAHSLLGRGKTSSAHVDGEGGKRLVDVAKAAGVKHFVYTSIFGVRPDHPVDFCRTKYAVEQHLRASGMPFTILRPSAFFVPHATMTGEPLLKKGKTTVFGQGNGVRNFIYAGDVAEVALRVLDDPQARGDCIDVGGWDNLTNNQVAELYGRVAGVPVKITHVPRGVLQLMASVIKPLQPGISTAMSFGLYSDTHNEGFDPSALLQRYPIKLTRLEDWVRQSIAVEAAAPKLAPSA
jgi:NADH dehydrogenase